ncbi:MAG: hypothetical protein AAF968_11280 [Pseudomonadota bacterium]
MAFGAGSTSVSVGHRTSRIAFGMDLDEVPIVFTDVTRQNGNGPGRARPPSLDEDGFGVFMEEDTSADPEVAHLREAIGFVAFEASGLLFGETLDVG